ncbi:MAG: hypothetical protein ACT4O0_15050 [Pseudonocardia sp.]
MNIPPAFVEDGHDPARAPPQRTRPQPSTDLPPDVIPAQRSDAPQVSRPGRDTVHHPDTVWGVSVTARAAARAAEQMALLTGLGPEIVVPVAPPLLEHGHDQVAGEGTFPVGAGLRPGSYRPDGPADAAVPTCYWAADGICPVRPRPPWRAAASAGRPPSRSGRQTRRSPAAVADPGPGSADRVAHAAAPTVRCGARACTIG